MSNASFIFTGIAGSCIGVALSQYVVGHHDIAFYALWMAVVATLSKVIVNQ